MQRILSTSEKALRQSILVLGMMLLIFLWILFIAIQPASYATTLEELKLIPPDASRLTPQEKIDRAYEFSEATGIREEERQKAYEQAIKDAENLESRDKAYERSLKTEQEKVFQGNLGEKAK